MYGRALRVERRFSSVKEAREQDLQKSGHSRWNGKKAGFRHGDAYRWAV